MTWKNALTALEMRLTTTAERMYESVNKAKSILGMAVKRKYKELKLISGILLSSIKKTNWYNTVDECY